MSEKPEFWGVVSVSNEGVDICAIGKQMMIYGTERDAWEALVTMDHREGLCVRRLRVQYMRVGRYED